MSNYQAAMESESSAQGGLESATEEDMVIYFGLDRITGLREKRQNIRDHRRSPVPVYDKEGNIVDYKPGHQRTHFPRNSYH